MNYILRQIVPGNSVKPIEIHLTEDEVQIGRRRIIYLSKYPQISRDHATFYKSDDGALFVKDLNSLNGIYVNESRIGSSLKPLSIGDVIGFGVPTTSVEEGFVCVLCVDNPPYAVKEEDASVIDLGFVNPGLQASVLGDRNASTSFNFLPSSKLPDDSIINNDSNIKVTDNVPVRKHTESLPTSVCVVRLTKCDSEYFEWPSDVKNPFLVRHQNEEDLMRRTSSHSSAKEEALRKGLPKSTPSMNQNSSLGSQNENRNQIVCQTPNIVKLEVIPKRECVDSSEETFLVPSAPTKPYSKKESVNGRECVDGSKVTSYSQVEEVIFISDDESYLDFNSQQNCVQVKSEPEDIEEPDDEIYKIFESDNEVTPGSVNPQNPGSVDAKESVESVRAFVSCAEQKSSKERERGSSTESDNDLMCVESPQESAQDSESSEGSSSEEDSNLVFPSGRLALKDGERIPKEKPMSDVRKENVEIGFTFAPNTSTNKSSKILLIDPRPMSYRPRRMRGRDEGFVERNKPVDLPVVEKKRGRGRPRNRPSLNDAVNCTIVRPGEKDKRFSNRDELVDETLTHQKRKRGRPRKVPMENEMARSNVVEKGYKIPRKSNNSVHADAKNVPVSSSNIANTRISQKRIPSVKTLPERFCSRMGFLISELEVNPQSRSKAGVGKNTCSNQEDKVQKSSRVNESGLSGKTEYSKVPASQNIAAPNVPPVITQGNVSSITSKLRDPRLKSLQRHTTENVTLLQKPNNVPVVRAALRDAPKTACSNAINSLLRFDLSFYGVVKALIRMNTKWLQEQSHLEVPPSVITDSAVNLPLSYNSYNSYVTAFYPMIMLEIWEYMYTESRVEEQGQKQFYFSIMSYMSREDYIELKCEAVVNEKVCFVPREGIIAILEMKENSNMCCPLFGYIFKHKVDPLDLESLKVTNWKRLPEEWLRGAKHWTFYAYIRKKELSIALNCLMKGRGICYIRSKLRLADALRFVRDSPLLTDILQPRISTFTLNLSSSSSTREYSASQMEIIGGIVAEVNKPLMEPKIILLHGPPGTGKTHTVIGLLEMLFYNCKHRSNLKVLVTAPSNVAVDEIGCRLIELNERSSWRDHSIKFVRVGLEKQIHPKIMPYFLDRKARDLYQLNSQASKRKEKELQLIRAEISKLEREAPSVDRNERLKYLTEQCSFLQKQTPVKEMDYNTDMMYKTDILKESHIVLSTLSCCGLSLLLKTFKPSSGLNFSLCIVDESTQCTELEILQPLVLGVNKLMLIGDNRQLSAPVLSKFAARCGLGRSMSERFSQYFEGGGGGKIPILVLKEQFRMHADICAFPSRHVYDRTLFTHPDVALRYRDFPLCPYIVLDVRLENQSDSNEGAVVSVICKFLMDLVVDCPSSIGILVSCQAQRSLYMKTLYGNPLCKEIEINTVDAFQGREKDVFLVSSLRASNYPEATSFLKCKRRFNVAVTRARKCLIVCAQSASMCAYPEWKALIEDARKRKLCFCVTSSRSLSSVLKNCLRKK